MLYSDEINKICGLCIFASEIDGEREKMQCSKKRKSVNFDYHCRKFQYDIFKKQVRRKKKLKTYNPSDFELI